MKSLLHPVPIACLLIAIIGAVRSDVAMVAVSLIAGFAALGLLSARREASRSDSSRGNLSADSRMLLRPIKRLADELQEFVSTNSSSQIVQVIGAEVVAESQGLFKQVTTSLTTRDEFQRLLRGRYEADKEIGKARMKLEFSEGSDKSTIETTIEARTAELAHYDSIELNVRRIELGVHQTEAALAEMKARLSVSVSGEKVDFASADDVRASIERLKSLSKSYDEAERMTLDA